VLLRTVIITLLAAASGGAASTAPPPILFAADNEPALNGDIFRLDANGRLANLSKSPFDDESPLVSPNGKWVAFVSERGGGPGIYEVGIDGAGLRRLDPPPHQIGASIYTPQLAWSPDGRRLAAVSGGQRVTLRILQPGRTPKVLERNSFVFGPSWSPDGKLLSVRTGSMEKPVVRAYTPTGRLAWQVPSSGYVDWSHQGLLTTTGKGWVKAYDEHGRPRFAVHGRAEAWSPDGSRLATVAGGTLAVRTADGRVFLRKSIRGLSGNVTDVAWMDNRRVLVNLDPRAPGVDTATGKVFAGSPRYFYGARSADNRLFAETRRQGSRFAVRVEPLPHGAARVYGKVGGCWDDGVFEDALTSLQFVPGRRSLVFESYCPELLAALYAVNADGTGLTRVTNEQKDDTQPAWSPDGTRIAYTRYDFVGESCKGCPGSLVVADGDGSSPHVLTTPSGDDIADSGPSWSPDGTKILFTRTSLSSPGELFVIPAAGGTPQSLHVQAGAAAWGPSRIAYVDWESEPVSMWTALPDGTDRQKVAQRSSQRPGTLGEPAWSHDGRLAFTDGTGGAVAIVSGGTTQHVRLPFTGIDSLGWSPDGTHFVVVGFTKGAAVDDVYTVRTDGTGRKRLTHNLEAYDASWR
jgi:Tol biopolymer transport system component